MKTKENFKMQNKIKEMLEDVFKKTVICLESTNDNFEFETFERVITQYEFEGILNFCNRNNKMFLIYTLKDKIFFRFF